LVSWFLSLILEMCDNSCIFSIIIHGGEGYRKILKIINDALATELIREDTAGRLYPNVELKVEGGPQGVRAR
jgi:hypothetical protein